MQRGGHRQRSSQILAFDKFHDQRAIFYAVDGRDVGMIQRCQHPCFTLESRHSVGITGESSGQDFDRDLAAQLGIGGAIDGPHAALTELGGNAVVGDGLRRRVPRRAHERASVVGLVGQQRPQ